MNWVDLGWLSWVGFTSILNSFTIHVTPTSHPRHTHVTPTSHPFNTGSNYVTQLQKRPALASDIQSRPAIVVRCCPWSNFETKCWVGDFLEFFFMDWKIVRCFNLLFQICSTIIEGLTILKKKNFCFSFIFLHTKYENILVSFYW